MALPLLTAAAAAAILAPPATLRLHPALPLPLAATRRAASPSMSSASKVYRRAQFWEAEACTLLEIANVLGRWRTVDQWRERTAFAAPTARRVDSMAQGGTLERYEYAQRNDLAERVAMQQNLPSLPFTDERLAAAFGKSVAEFDAMPVSKVAIDVVFDALVESKASMVKAAAADERRRAWVAEDGSINEGALAAGLYKSRALVIFSWLFFGKGRVVGVLVAGRVALDNLKLDPEIIPYADYLYWFLAIVAAVNGVQSQSAVVAATSDYETVSREESDAAQAGMKEEAQYSTVFEKFAAARKAGKSGMQIDKSEYASFGVLAIVLFFLWFLPSYSKSQGWS
ncbi:hypothetical protein AB1Y20_002715 [Prymnesium parvum]|uniref:Uncharacterized protein n=1 Tax=Prymnesium parvum TaxID=97485 RepID=A0AB34JBS3_PRYPA